MKRLLILGLAILALACDSGPIKRVKTFERAENYWGSVQGWHNGGDTILVAEDGSKCRQRPDVNGAELTGKLVQCNWVTVEAVKP